MTRLYRTQSHRLFLLFGVSMCLATWLPLIAVRNPTSWLFATSGVFYAVFARRLGQSGIVVEGCNLTIKNPFTRPLSLSARDVAGFEMARWGLFPSMGYVVLAVGERIHVWGIQARNPMFFKTDPEIESMMKELEQWRYTCRVEGSAESPDNGATVDTVLLGTDAF